MNSMLQQAPTISKAIELAWDNSGRPSEFTIKILENGKKGFLGIASKPFVVSISYEPKNQTIRFKKEVKKSFVRPVSKDKKQSKASGFMKAVFGEKGKNKAQKPIPGFSRQQQVGEGRQEHFGVWNKELIDDVSFWLKDMIKIMNIKINFNCKMEQRLLNVYLDRKILRDNEEEKMLFISWSNILMQFLKKKYRKKFKNFFIIIHSNTNNTNNANGAKK